MSCWAPSSGGFKVYNYFTIILVLCLRHRLRITASKVISVTRDGRSQSRPDVWATTLMWRVWERWRVRDRRGMQWNTTKGPRGRCPIGTGEKWLHATDMSPLCQMPLFPHGTLSVFSGGGSFDSWPTFTSLFPSSLKCEQIFIFYHVFECFFQS